MIRRYGHDILQPRLHLALARTARQPAREPGIPYYCDVPGSRENWLDGLRRRRNDVFTPTVQAIVPDLVSHDQLASANSVSQISSQVAILIGQAIGGILYLSVGSTWLLLFDALSFGYATLATWFIPADAMHAPRQVSVRNAISQYLAETQEGISFVRHSGMTPLLMVFAGVNFLFMPVFILLPLYVRNNLSGGSDWYGFLLAGSGLGALCGAAVAGLLLTKLGAYRQLLRACVTGVGCCVVGLPLTKSALLALLIFVAVGLLSSMINVIVITFFQSAVPTEVRGRVMALIVTVSTAAVPIGMGLGGLMGDLWRDSLNIVFGTCGGTIMLLGIFGAQGPFFRWSQRSQTAARAK